jgi:hypothetical protein
MTITLKQNFLPHLQTPLNLEVRPIKPKPLIVTRVLNPNASNLKDISKLVIYIYLDGKFVMKSPVLSLFPQSSSMALGKSTPLP